MLKVSLHSSRNKRGLAMISTFLGELLLAVDPIREFSVFKSATHTAATTTRIATPRLGQSLRLTDLVISGEKIASGTITVRFNDGTYVENIYTAEVSDSVIDFSWAPAGRVQGWANAWIDFITDTLNQDATCLITYLHVSSGRSLRYDAWNSLR